MGRPKTSSLNVVCVEHPSSRVSFKGSRTSSNGLARRFRCVPGTGTAHYFTLVEYDRDVALSARWSAPPACPDHPGSRVVRNGRYGSKTPKPRQRYLCTPADGSNPHSFTPPLPRDHVHENAEDCSHCEELRGVHRGETAVARRRSWSTRIVARGLEQLAAGATYADVGRWALRATGTVRTRTTPVSADPAAEAKRVSAASKESRRAWHIAADWTEAFSPVIYSPVDESLRSQAMLERARLDALFDAGEPLERPQVVLLDDVPVYGRDLGAKTRSRRDRGYYILCAAELLWATRVLDPYEDPFGAQPPPTQKLRLLRAMPKSNTPAWRLVFDELGYAPDFIVADAGTGIAAAIAAHFDPSYTRFIPSLWHLTRSVERSLADTVGAFTASPTGSGRELIGPLAEHTRKLSRHSGVLDSPDTWSAWWDELLDILTARRLPTNKIANQRRDYEGPMAAVLDDLAVLPDIPVSTGGLETLIAKHVTPLLAMRRTSFANIERTNLLLDLVVARHHGAFDDLGDIVKLLRGDTIAHAGWTVPLRRIADPKPRKGTYSSLRDTTLLDSLAKQRGLT